MSDEPSDAVSFAYREGLSFGRLQATEEMGAEILALKDELNKAMVALHFGGHLRRDGTVCGYSESEGGICNKCGWARRARVMTETTEGA